MKFPSGDYYLAKENNTGLGHFIWRASARDKKGGTFYLGTNNISVPDELMGKKLMFKLEILKENKK